MRKKRILFISAFGEFVGGGQHSLLLLLKGLDRAKYVPVVVCPGEGVFVNALRDINISVLIFPFPSLKTFNLKRLFNTIEKLKCLLSMCNPDVVHTESPRSIPYLKCALHGGRIPLVWHVRVGNAEPFLYEWVLFKCVSHVVAVSNAVRKRFMKFRDANRKVRVIYNAVDIHDLDFDNAGDVHEEQEREKQYIKIGIIGQIIPLKGHMTVIESAARIFKRVHNVKFIIVGHGDASFEAVLKQHVAEYGLEDHVRFMGYRKDVLTVMSSLDIVINASYKGKEWEEGFSRVIIEAMAMGKPVIATDVGGNAEAIEHEVSGIIIPPADTYALTEAVIGLVLDQGKRARFGSAAKERVRRYFELAKNIKDTEDLYAEIS